MYPRSRPYFLSTSIAITKTLGVLIGTAMVDRVGRRPLLIWGAVGSAASMVALTVIGAAGIGGGGIAGAVILLTAMCAFILAFSLSWAGLYWVVVSEIFSMLAKSAASSAATSLLFLTGERACGSRIHIISCRFKSDGSVEV